MHIFLQGRSGIGKSYLLRKVLTPYSSDLSGLYVQRLTRNNAIIGFKVECFNETFQPLDMEYSPEKTGIFMLFGERHVNELEEAIRRVKDESGKTRCKLVLLDEIGGFELTSPAFMSVLREILHGNKICFGVFKSSENLAHESRVLNLGVEYIALHKELEAQIKNLGELLTVTENNLAETHDYLIKRLNGICFHFPKK